ncbi:hypothetical protein JZ751_010211 [Albula glossodonta]|uniref:Uncharacterized protein n=1 Tax=Albula glossodonta TaxID=121402 RepID=A0A8T2N7I0_9TELE|nr:hypothetical protein JZ751_010211 [Albula glossodonta]
MAERSKALRSGRSLPWRRGFESCRLRSYLIDNTESSQARGRLSLTGCYDKLTSADGATAPQWLRDCAETLSIAHRRSGLVVVVGSRKRRRIRLREREAS